MLPRICLDMDEVIADTYAKFLDIYEATYGHRPEPAAYAGKKIYELPGASELREQMYAPGFFRDLPVMENAPAVVQELQQDYDVWITTAATEFRECLTDKYDWLQTHFSFISYKRFVFCGDKSIFRGEYMIDDKGRNLRPFPGTRLLFTASHNLHETDFIRVDNWLEVRDFFRRETARRRK